MEKSYIYGPVPSRRLGRSLGIDLVPHKICSFNCIYCQLGRTTAQTVLRKEYIPAKRILKDLKAFINKHPEVDYITISGSGEPTLNSKLGFIIRSIKKVTKIPVAVITNGTLLFMEDVQEDLLNADVVLPTLSTVSGRTFKMLHRPHPKLHLKNIIKGLKDFRKKYKGKIYLEIMLIKGINDSRKELKALQEVISQIGFDKIQLNTVVRPPCEPYAPPLSPKELLTIKRMMGKNCEVIAAYKKKSERLSIEKKTEAILDFIKRRPATLLDIISVLKLNPNLTIKILTHLEQKKRIKRVIHNHKYYYVEHIGI